MSEICVEGKEIRVGELVYYKGDAGGGMANKRYKCYGKVFQVVEKDQVRKIHAHWSMDKEEALGAKKDNGQMPENKVYRIECARAKEL